MDQLIPTQLNLLPLHQKEIIRHAERTAPIEACGIVAGQDGVSVRVFPIRNALQSPIEYRMEESELVKVFWEIEAHRWQVMAFYHSHPASFPRPSETDLARCYYPDTPQIIAGKTDSGWELRAYQFGKITYQEIPLGNPPVT